MRHRSSSEVRISRIPSEKAYHAPVLTLLLALTTALPAFELEDQFEKKHRSSQLEGRVLLMIGGDQHKSDLEIRDWAALIRGAFGDRVQVVGLANLDGVPFFVPDDAVRKGVRESNPKTIVLCDWDDDAFTRLGFPKDLTSVLVFDSTGKLIGKISGRADPDRLNALRKLVEPLL